jgi:hypothetical protein
MLPVVTMSRPALDFSALTSSSSAPRRTVVCPSGVLEFGGDDVLRHLVEVVGDAGGVVGLQWPVPAHVLEGHASEEQRIRSVALFPQRRLDVGLIDVGVVSGWSEPSPGSVDDTIECDVLGDDQIPHTPNLPLSSYVTGTGRSWRRIRAPATASARARSRAGRAVGDVAGRVRTLYRVPAAFQEAPTELLDEVRRGAGGTSGSSRIASQS